MLPRITRNHIDAVLTVALSFPNFTALTVKVVMVLSLKLRLGEVPAEPQH